MAKVFAKVRYTGTVSNDVARAFQDALEQVNATYRDCGVEVQGVLDVRLDPEPAPVSVPFNGIVLDTDDLTLVDGPEGPETVVSCESPE